MNRISKYFEEENVKYVPAIEVKKPEAIVVRVDSKKVKVYSDVLPEELSLLFKERERLLEDIEHTTMLQIVNIDSKMRREMKIIRKSEKSKVVFVNIHSKKLLFLDKEGLTPFIEEVKEKFPLFGPCTDPSCKECWRGVQ